MSEESKNLSRGGQSDGPRRGPQGGGNGGGGTAVATSAGGGFFSVYKSGQGYWTRLCTAIVAGAILLLVARWVYTESQIRLATALTGNGRTIEMAGSLARKIMLGITSALVLVAAGFVWKVMNSPKGAEFLITTDSEMKKVNWASRRELFGSTRVVILFMIFICVFLFLSDIAFGWFFHQIGVLKAGPFST